ncbi:YbbR-like domain-containing protein [Mucilaginibacter ginkgonis]|uniref:YbbR-like domain-containing protein n=2 Tax=Mucilaginibacter ginkgonis TaxID=2682091 RepID=A0A6I4I3A7_9SPHI|nr:YbbR-like domain-containing protein [Mucilaginibacter ginkgonis]
MAIIKLSPTERRRLSAFVTCCVVAFAAWLLTVLQGSYNYKVKCILTYNNIPQRRAFRTLQSDTVVATLQGSGWQMLSARMHNEDEHIAIDLHTLDTKNFIALEAQLPQINSKRSAEQKITDFDPDTLYFDFTNRSTKRVPVKLLKNITFQPQFDVAGNVRLNPAYVFVSGPAATINKITEWSTDSLKVTDVEANVQAKVDIAKVRDGNVSIYPKIIQVFVPVEEFTEKTLEIPVQLSNNVHYYDVKIFPQKVKVTFMTPLSKFAEINDDYFDAVADFGLWAEHKYSSLPVKITRLPAYTKIVKIEPQNVDFIVKK